MNTAHIASTGLFVPARVQTAEELAPLLGRSAEWIRSRTGVGERRISDLSMPEMAAAAAREALGEGPPPDLVINASVTPVQLLPDSSVFILRELGLNGIPGFSVHCSCLSFLVALQQAAAMVACGGAKRVLVVSSEKATDSRDFTAPESAALLGDGAAAAVIEPSEGGSAILGTRFSTWPESARHAEIRGFGTRHHPSDPQTTSSDNLFHMNGPRLLRRALPAVAELVGGLLGEHGLSPEQVDVVVPHQASGLGVRAVQRFGFRPDQVVDVVGEYGNCVAASMPMALARAERDGRLRLGSTVLLLGTGSGLSVGGALLRW